MIEEKSLEAGKLATKSIKGVYPGYAEGREGGTSYR